MDLPKVPTDNLHKFKAIGGLVAFLGIIGAICAFGFQLQEKIFLEKAAVINLETDVKIAEDEGKKGTTSTDLTEKSRALQGRISLNRVEVDHQQILIYELIGFCVIGFVLALGCVKVTVSGFRGWAKHQSKADSKATAETIKSWNDSSSRRE